MIVIINTRCKYIVDTIDEPVTAKNGRKKKSNGRRDRENNYFYRPESAVSKNYLKRDQRIYIAK